MEADVVYDSPDLVVRHIKNKQASVHYGLSTKWCVSMLREEHFEEYEAHNATFFFFERRSPVGDAFDKVAVMLPRNGGGRDVAAQAFTSDDQQTDMMGLARVYGPRVFDVFRDILARSDAYPGSTTFCVYAGQATREQLETVLSSVTAGSTKTMNPYATGELLESICCNDAAPPAMLEEILRSAVSLVTAAAKRWNRRSRHYRVRDLTDRLKDLERTIMAALVIHPNTPADLRATVVKDLRRRHVNIDNIHRVSGHGQIGVQYREPRHVRYRMSRRRPNTVASLRAMAERLERKAVRTRKKAKTLERKLAARRRSEGDDHGEVQTETHRRRGGPAPLVDLGRGVRAHRRPRRPQGGQPGGLLRGRRRRRHRGHQRPHRSQDPERRPTATGR